jgi:hypothetical protein
MNYVLPNATPSDALGPFSFNETYCNYSFQLDEVKSFQFALADDTVYRASHAITVLNPLVVAPITFTCRPRYRGNDSALHCGGLKARGWNELPKVSINNNSRHQLLDVLWRHSARSNAAELGAYLAYASMAIHLSIYLSTILFPITSSIVGILLWRSFRYLH